MIAMKNAMGQLVSLMKSGVHPTAVLNALEQDDDLVRQLRSRLDGASPEQLMNIAHGIHSMWKHLKQHLSDWSEDLMRQIEKLRA